MAAICYLVGLRVLLTCAWSSDLYKKGGGVEQPADSDDKTSVNIQEANAAILDPFCWAYMVMLDKVAEVLLHISMWAESCPCHGHSQALHGTQRHARAAAFKRRWDESGCPLRTMKAVELVAGYIFTLLNDCLGIVNSSLLHDPLVARLDAEGKAKTLREFASLRRHIFFTFSAKLAFWNQNTWILIGLAHSDCDIARSCCRRAVTMADSVVDWAKQHPITQALLQPGSRGRQMLQEFIDGRDLQSLPLLESYAAMFRFVRVTERWIEAVHAINKKVFALAPHAGAVHLCFHLELRQLRKVLESQHDVLERMAVLVRRGGAVFEACCAEPAFSSTLQ